MEDLLLRIDSPVLYFTGLRELTVEQGLTLSRGVTVISGPNGSGKTLFAKIIEKGKNFRTNRIFHFGPSYPKVKYLEFHDIHSMTGLSVGYYQQRYEASMNDEVPTIGEILGEKAKSDFFQKLCTDFNLSNIESKKANSLSSGELRKFLVINALSDLPDLLILDNPYIGLDKNSRIILNSFLKKLKEDGKSVWLILSDKEDAPEFADSHIYVNSLKVQTSPYPLTETISSHFPFSGQSGAENFTEEICKLRNCNISYGSKSVIRNLNWTIKSGERWSLFGDNGSGKSTLLSLINADNPQGYCHDLVLFGKRRGSGESIWDIKKHIGYVSPEMQLHFHGEGTVIEVLANGLNDTVGLFVKPTESQLQEASKWLEYFQLSHLKDCRFSSLSSGERQLILVARSFIKQPRLLILDEPMHALDRKNRTLVEMAIEDFLETHPLSSMIMVTHNPEELPSSISHHLHLETSQ